MQAKSPDISIRFWVISSYVGGAAAAAAVSCLLLAFSSSGSVLSFLKDWQTLIAGVLALVGAVLTVLAVARQIQRTGELEEQRRWRRHFADRAMMPMALDALTVHTEACIDILKAYLRSGVAKNQSRVSFPKLPPDVLPTMRQCIESADPDAMQKLSDVVADIQIVHARLQSFSDELQSKTQELSYYQDVNSHLRDLLILDIKLQTIFPYARRSTSQLDTSIEKSELETRAFFLDLYEEEHPKLYAYLRNGRTTIMRRD